MNRLIFPFFAAIFLLKFRPILTAATWPCLQVPNPTGVGRSDICHDGSPCVPVGANLECNPPGCTNDADCAPFTCRPLASGATVRSCEDFVQKSVGAPCTTHLECGPDKICAGTGTFTCMDVPSGTAFFGSSFVKCVVGSTTCVTGIEECVPNPVTNPTEGICLQISTTASDLVALLAGKLSPAGGTTPAGGVTATTGVKEGQPCTVGLTKCEVPLFCDSDGTCKRTNALRSPVSGHRIPPPPGNPNCRDALDSGERDETKSKCTEREELCTEPLYVEMMKEQCPKTCGYCDDPSLDLSDYVEEENIRPSGKGTGTGGGTGTGTGTVKVDPSAACSDRKLPDKESDCPNLKNLCQNPIYKPLLEQECPKTCGFCT